MRKFQRVEFFRAASAPLMSRAPEPLPHEKPNRGLFRSPAAMQFAQTVYGQTKGKKNAVRESGGENNYGMRRRRWKLKQKGSSMGKFLLLGESIWNKLVIPGGRRLNTNF